MDTLRTLAASFAIALVIWGMGAMARMQMDNPPATGWSGVQQLFR